MARYMFSQRPFTRKGSYILFNFCSAIGVIFLNKLIFSQVTFGFPTALSLVHYTITFLGLWTLRTTGQFVARQSPMTGRLWILSMVVGLAPPLNNLSLKLNSMGYYTLVKLLVTPLIVAIEFIFEGKTVSHLRTCALVCLAGGVAMASTGEVVAQPTGILVSMLWLPVAAVYKVLWSRSQKEDGWDTLALMYHILPKSMVFMALLMPFTDPSGVTAYQFTWSRVGLIGASGVAAFAVNYSGFLVLGACAPLTHVVLGQVKSAALVLGGFALFGQRYSSREVLGSAIAIVSSGLYAHFTSFEKRTEPGSK